MAASNQICLIDVLRCFCRTLRRHPECFFERDEHAVWISSGTDTADDAPSGRVAIQGSRRTSWNWWTRPASGSWSSRTEWPNTILRSLFSTLWLSWTISKLRLLVEDRLRVICTPTQSFKERQRGAENDSPRLTYDSQLSKDPPESKDRRHYNASEHAQKKSRWRFSITWMRPTFGLHPSCSKTIAFLFFWITVTHAPRILNPSLNLERKAKWSILLVPRLWEAEPQVSWSEVRTLSCATRRLYFSCILRTHATADYSMIYIWQRKLKHDRRQSETRQ